MFKVRLRRHSCSKKFTKAFSIIEKLFNEVNKNVNISAMECKTRELGRQILNLLGPNHGLLFLEYEKSIYLTESYCIEDAYRLGLKARNGNKK